MKRKVLASVLGLAALALVSSSYGQGQVNFQNYSFTSPASLNAPITFGTTANVGGVNGVAGTRIGSEFTADLLYSFDGGANYTLLTGPNSQDASYPTPFAFGLGADGDTANFAGYFFGNTVTIPGYTSGNVTFIFEAYHGSSYATADWKGQSAAFSIPIAFTGGAGSPPPPTDLTSGPGALQSFVVTVPEPGIFALGGLGAAGLMAFRRKKA